MKAETLRKRDAIQREIAALRRSRDTDAAYGDSGKADALLDEIADLELQLQQTTNRGASPHKRERTDECQNSLKVR